MNYENLSIYLFANQVDENVQKVNINCNCGWKLNRLESETSLIRTLVQENRVLLEGILNFISSEDSASSFASIDPASVSESVDSEIGQFIT